MRMYDGLAFYKTQYGYHERRGVGLLHRYIWEKMNGKIPNGYIVHHKDGNRDNNNMNNLQCMSLGDHTSLHQKGKIISEHTKNEMRKSSLGCTHNEDTKKRIFENQPYRRIIKCIETGKIYQSVNQAKRETKINNITSALMGRLKTSGGYHWEYLT